MTTLDLLESWRPSDDTLIVERDWKRHAQYNDRSISLSFPPTEEPEAPPVTLPLFGCASSSGSMPTQGMLDNTEAHDVILHVGGPVWGLDWCPSTSEIETADGNNTVTVSYLAVGCHPTYSSSNQIGVPISGPGVLQIWQLPHPDEELVNEQLPQPKLAVGLIHDGGLVWQCKWCPSSEIMDDTRLGLVAAAMGDGSVRVWPIPHPPSSSEEEEPYMVEQDTVVMINSSHLGGILPSCIDWLPTKPNDLLLVGCWDGSVAIIKLLSQGFEVLQHFSGDTVPLRSVRWLPDSVGVHSTIDDVHRHVFMSAGHEGTCKIWDRRNEFEPVYWQGLSTYVVFDSVWTSEPFGVMSAVEDGSVRAILLGYEEILRQRGTKGTKAVHSSVWRGTNVGCIWCIDCHPTTNQVAYAGEDGVVGHFVAEYKWDIRKRKPHDALAGLKMENGALNVLSSVDLVADAGLYVDRMGDRNQTLAATMGVLPDEMQAIYRVAWNHTTPSWLASGGAAGLVRCQLVHSM